MSERTCQTSSGIARGLKPDYDDIARRVVAAFEAWLKSRKRRFPARSTAWRHRNRPEFLAALRAQLRDAGFPTDEDFEMLLAALAINKRITAELSLNG